MDNIWPAALTMRDGALVADLPWPVSPVSDDPGFLRVDGSDLYLNTAMGEGLEVCGTFWAGSPQAFLKQLQFAHDDHFFAALPAAAPPPALLLPPGADSLGTFASVKSALEEQDLGPRESGSYRIMQDGAFVGRTLSTGRAGIRYTYLDREADDAPVALIALALARDDWAPDPELRQRITRR